MAERLAPADVPEPLRPWVDWALRGSEAALCPSLEESGQSICQWPGRLALDLGEAGGEFRLEVHADQRGAFALPGGPTAWPEDVRVGGRPMAVVARAGSPAVELEPGSHEVRGRFVWPRLPTLLRVPPELGLVALRLEGSAVAFPARDLQGRLWLRTGGEEPDAGERRLEVEVHRKVTDEVPLLLETRVTLQVSGPAREERLGPVLPAGFVPLGLVSPLPARIEPDGSLRVQVRAGRFELQLAARHEGPAAALGLPPAAEGSLWPASEVWVFEARPALRLVTVEGVPVDPQQTSLPGEWRALPAYRLVPDALLRFVERRRGDAEPAPDELHLARRLSLDFDGGGATVSDRLTGTVHARRRLEMGEGTELGRAAVNGVDQFLTRLGDSPRAGVQVSPGAVQVDADSRVASAGRLPAVGWHEDVASLAATLELPPGYDLLHASGVDRAHSTWLNRWTLLDLFVALVVAVAFLRLYGVAFGVLAGVTLALTATEPGAPRWIWVAVLAVEALRRAVPEGRFVRTLLAARVLALAALVVLAVPFAVAALRAGLYPALAQPGAELIWQPSLAAEEDTAADESLAMPEAAPAASEPEVRRQGKLRRYVDIDRLTQEGAAANEARAKLPSVDPNARITTGPGIPSWSWRRVDLEWSGPVEKDAVLRLVMLPPWASALLAVLRALLLGVLVARVLGARFARSMLPAVPGAAIALLAFPLAAAPAGATEFPPAELLEELRERLTEAPDCRPACAAIAMLRLEARGDRLRLAFDVSVAAATALPLPGSASGWIPADVRADGASARALLRDGDGTLWLRLERGLHAVELEGPLPASASVALPLPLAPQRAEARLEGWTLEGIRPDGSVEATLQLVRDVAANAEGSKAEAPALPPFVRVERFLLLGLTWEVRTEVERLSPADSALVVEIPLLEGESVTTADTPVRERYARVALPPGVSHAAFRSHLALRDEIVLTAPEGVPWSEAWQLAASPIWHLTPQGIPPVQADAAGGRGSDLAWRPWPGESVRIGIARPEGISGATLTLDASQLALRPGLRSTDATLTLALRSSQGGEHRVTLPEGSQLQRVAVDGAELPLRQEGRAVVLPVRPGTQSVELGWREPTGIRPFWRAAEVDVGAPPVNAEVSVEPPAGRWLLFVSGPPLGPAVLFWPVLAAYLGIALALGRLRLTPLRSPHWALLAVGLTQVGIVGAATVALWLLALGWRGEHGMRVRQPWFDLMQIALVALTLAAFVALFEAIRAGLLGQPDMQIAGNASHAGMLRWYQDRSAATLPRPLVVSLPLFVYRLAMLAWALWIAQALVGWLRFGWRAFATGELWLPLRRRAGSGGAP